jgi:hypothetical protein
MKIVEVTHYLTVAITNEEANMLNQFDDSTPVMTKSDMDERQQLLANQLVNKDLLVRKNENGRITYKRKNR